jgi:hypothetical protein
MISSRCAVAAVLAAACWLSPALAGTYEAPLDVRKDGEAKFATPPKAEAAGDKVKITFGVSAPTATFGSTFT